MGERLGTYESPEQPKLKEAQEQALRGICERYGVDFNASDYLVHRESSWMMPGWAEGWVGGTESTIYVGVSPEGEIHS